MGLVHFAFFNNHSSTVVILSCISFALVALMVLVLLAEFKN